MEDGQPSECTCKTCSNQSLIATHAWTILVAHAVAGWPGSGPLGAEQLWHFIYMEKTEDDQENDPENVWPDPGYLGSWQQKGWLQKGCLHV